MMVQTICPCFVYVKGDPSDAGKSIYVHDALECRQPTFNAGAADRGMLDKPDHCAATIRSEATQMAQAHVCLTWA